MCLVHSSYKGISAVPNLTQFKRIKYNKYMVFSLLLLPLLVLE